MGSNSSSITRQKTPSTPGATGPFLQTAVDLHGKIKRDRYATKEKAKTMEAATQWTHKESILSATE